MKMMREVQEEQSIMRPGYLRSGLYATHTERVPAHQSFPLGNFFYYRQSSLGR
jgi:hypothetical protein